MKNEFVKYEQALALKELGFDEPCLAFWDNKNTDAFYFNNKRDASGDYVPFQKHDKLKWFGAPLYQQAFRWFRNKYHIYGEISILNISEKQGVDCELTIKPLSDKNGIAEYYKILGVFEYKDAEDICLNELINIIKYKL